MGVTEVVGETVVVWLIGLAGLVKVCTLVTAVAGAEGVVGADVLEVGVIGLIGLTGLVGFVGLLIDFLQVSDTVIQGANTGTPYGSGQEDVRVWVVKPI